MCLLIGGSCKCGSVCSPQIVTMLFGFGTFVLAIGSVQCAVIQYKLADLQPLPPSLEMSSDLQPAASNLMESESWLPASYFIQLQPLDLQPEASDVIWSVQAPVADLQPAASKVIELDQLDPQNQPLSSSFSLVETSGGSVSGRSGSARKSKSHFFDDDTNEQSSKQMMKNDGQRSRVNEKSKAQPQQAKSGRPQLGQSPRSINELLEGRPLQVAGSSKSPTKVSGDLKKSGSYVSGIGGGGGFDEGYDKEKHFDKEGGKKYLEAHKEEEAKKEQQGYKKEEGFDKAEDEKHGKEDKKAIINEKQGEKKAHVEKEKKFGEEYKGTQGEKGVTVTKKGGHKKGKKNKGFHKVHHKDEYKKDEVFYDESHDGDEHEEHAHEQEKHSKEKGGNAKKTLVDSQYHEGHGEKKGVQDKGHSFEEASGHKKQAAKEVHSDKKSEYDKKAGVKEGKKYGHAEGGGSAGGYEDHGFF